MTSFPRLIIVAALAAGLGACDPIDAFCVKRHTCDPRLEDDAVRVCVIERETRDAALRANDDREPECDALADAFLAFDGCRAALDCDDFEEPDNNGRCAEEREDLEDALEDAGNECTSRD